MFPPLETLFDSYINHMTLASTVSMNLQRATITPMASSDS